jgi:hypothetical protein
MKYIILNDFFESPDTVREQALKRRYVKSTKDMGWKGYRCPIYETDIISYIKNKLLLIDKDFITNKEISTYFHYTLDNTKNEIEDFHFGKLHADSVRWAGVIYLTPNPNPNSGTTLHDSSYNLVHTIDNVYNRLVLYDGYQIHGPEDTFGDDILNGRLTLTLFIDDVKKKNNTLI